MELHLRSRGMDGTARLNPFSSEEIFHPHLHDILADGYWKGYVFTRFPEIKISGLSRAFTELVLALRHKPELISAHDVLQILSQDHTGLLSMDERTL